MNDCQDIKYMKLALKLSRNAVGLTEPNPMVGAVAVKDNQIVATGFHSRFGAPHAEREALRNVPDGTTLYVTMEPCCHVGKTPACTDIIMEKKVRRVVTAMIDPNPLVNGKGVRILQRSGIPVETGLLEQTARDINRHYITYITQKRPYVTLKAGVSMDGKLTDKFRKSQWVTSPQLRKISHSLRGEFSAIMAGAKTIIDDNPNLTIREKGWDGKILHRVILDTHNTLDTNLRIFREQPKFPVLVFSSAAAKNRTPKTEKHFFLPDANHCFNSQDSNHNTVPGSTLDSNHQSNTESASDSKSNLKMDLKDVLETLHQQGISSLLVEGGGQLIDSFLQQGLYDEIILFQAGTLIGGSRSVQLFAGGTSVSQPLELARREIIPLNTGHIIRGYRSGDSGINPLKENIKPAV